jgi:hypothetical protein
MNAALGMSPHQVRGLDGEMIVTGRINGTKAAQEVRAQVLEATLRRSHNWNPTEVFHRRDGNDAEAASGTRPAGGRRSR